MLVSDKQENVVRLTAQHHSERLRRLEEEVLPIDGLNTIEWQFIRFSAFPVSLIDSSFSRGLFRSSSTATHSNSATNRIVVEICQLTSIAIFAVNSFSLFTFDLVWLRCLSKSASCFRCGWLDSEICRNEAKSGSTEVSSLAPGRLLLTD